MRCFLWDCVEEGRYQARLILQHLKTKYQHQQLSYTKYIIVQDVHKMIRLFDERVLHIKTEKKYKNMFAEIKGLEFNLKITFNDKYLNYVIFY